MSSFRLSFAMYLFRITSFIGMTIFTFQTGFLECLLDFVDVCFLINSNDVIKLLSVDIFGLLWLLSLIIIIIFIEMNKTLLLMPSQSL